MSLNELSQGILTFTMNLARIGEEKKVYRLEEFSRLFVENVKEFMERYTFAGKIGRLLANRLGVDPEVILNLNWAQLGLKLREIKTQDINEFIRAMDSLAKDNRRTLVVFLDEFQYIKKVNNFDVGSFLHDIYDWCDNTVIIVSGSIVGVAEEVLKQVEATKPFYGRKFFKVYLKTFTEEQSTDFLKKGFEQEGVRVEDVTIERAVKLFDGIPGWLTLFGKEYTYSVKHGRKADIKDILKEAGKEVAIEFTRFLKNSSSPNRYSGIILAIDRLGGKGKLSEITQGLNVLLKDNAEESRVKELLDTLISYGYIVKTGRGRYSLPNDTPTKIGIKHSAKKWLKTFS
ncbi:ATPase [Candidatus Acidianus copahuensis]|uniref:ATPase n=1 Tax=Candidatus Acidianus copahuensis TaxID=1160895 RepID=A0A031LNN3_9CREN|nr:ATPase [Candidatus Acidianus copahuensis]